MLSCQPFTLSLDFTFRAQCTKHAKSQGRSLLNDPLSCHQPNHFTTINSSDCIEISRVRLFAWTFDSEMGFEKTYRPSFGNINCNLPVTQKNTLLIRRSVEVIYEWTKAGLPQSQKTLFSNMWLSNIEQIFP